MQMALILAAALVAAPIDPYNDVQQMRLAFAQIHSVQAVERFGNGAAASVVYTPYAGPRVSIAANTGTEALLDYITQPGGDPNVDLHRLFTITSLGVKTVATEKLWGYSLTSLSGNGSEIVWVNAHYLPVKAHIAINGQTVDVLYGNYDVPLYFATR